MNCVRIAPANSFLGLVESSSKIEPQSKQLYKQMHDIWKAMHQFCCQLDKDLLVSKQMGSEQLTSILFTAFVKRRFKVFHDWMEKQNQQMSGQIDFPLEMLASIQAIYIESLGRLWEGLFDDSLFDTTKGQEQRLAVAFLKSANEIASSRTHLLYAEYLAKRWVLLLDPYTYPQCTVKLEEACRGVLLDLEEDDRRNLSTIIDNKQFNFKAVQLRFSCSINLMFNDYFANLVKRIHNIYEDAHYEAVGIQFWRNTQGREKRKLAEEVELMQKKVKSTDEQNAKLNSQVNDLLNKCLAVSQEIEKLRAEALKKLDANALDADEVVRSYHDMSRDLQNRNEMLQQQLESLTRERNDLRAQLSSKGVLGRWLT
jgi:chaperonin cofactor prefoldin